MDSSVICLEENRDRSKVDEKTAIQYAVNSKNCKLFQLFFLADDEDQRVEVVETQEIDFEEVIQHIRRGESVFITCKSPQESNPSPMLIKDAREPWYFTHI